MNLTREPETVNWTPIHYVYIEKIGPFQNTAQTAWQTLHTLVAKISEHNKITGFLSLYNPDPKKMIYRAGVSIAAAASQLPDGLEYCKFDGGNYARFVLTGSYANLPQACGIAFDTFAQKKLPRRDAFCIENYVNDPKTTPEEKLTTEILIPTL